MSRTCREIFNSLFIDKGKKVSIIKMILYVSENRSDFYYEEN